MSDDVPSWDMDDEDDDSLLLSENPLRKQKNPPAAAQPNIMAATTTATTSNGGKSNPPTLSHTQPSVKSTGPKIDDSFDLSDTSDLSSVHDSRPALKPNTISNNMHLNGSTKPYISTSILPSKPVLTHAVKHSSTADHADDTADQSLDLSFINSDSDLDLSEISEKPKTKIQTAQVANAKPSTTASSSINSAFTKKGTLSLPKNQPLPIFNTAAAADNDSKPGFGALSTVKETGLTPSTDTKSRFSSSHTAVYTPYQTKQSSIHQDNVTRKLQLSSAGNSSASVSESDSSFNSLNEAPVVKHTQPKSNTTTNSTSSVENSSAPNTHINKSAGHSAAAHLSNTDTEDLLSLEFSADSFEMDITLEDTKARTANPAKSKGIHTSSTGSTSISNSSSITTKSISAAGIKLPLTNAAANSNSTPTTNTSSGSNSSLVSPRTTVHPPLPTTIDSLQQRLRHLESKLHSERAKHASKLKDLKDKHHSQKEEIRSTINQIQQAGTDELELKLKIQELLQTVAKHETALRNSEHQAQSNNSKWQTLIQQQQDKVKSVSEENILLEKNKTQLVRAAEDLKLELSLMEKDKCNEQETNRFLKNEHKNLLMQLTEEKQKYNELMAKYKKKSSGKNNDWDVEQSDHSSSSSSACNNDSDRFSKVSTELQDAATLASERKRSATERTQLTDQVQQLRQRNEELDQANLLLQEQLTRLESKLKQKDTEIEYCYAELSVHETQQKMKSEKISAQQNQIELLKKQLTALHQQQTQQQHQSETNSSPRMTGADSNSLGSSATNNVDSETFFTRPTTAPYPSSISSHHAHTSSDPSTTDYLLNRLSSRIALSSTTPDLLSNNVTRHTHTASTSSPFSPISSTRPSTTLPPSRFPRSSAHYHSCISRLRDIELSAQLSLKQAQLTLQTLHFQSA